MAHFVKLDENNIVFEVVVVNNDVLDADNEEASGIVFLNNLYGIQENWKQTSYNGNIRKNYAGIGYLFDGVGFYAPQPYPSWTKDAETYLWNAPVAMPVEEGKRFTWDEDTLAWVETE